ncbi:hypothetical protein HYW61_01550 [candidate division WWE3 bacterium]|nr:hypothetical protein [candidate division WWE3 bacterium]
MNLVFHELVHVAVYSIFAVLIFVLWKPARSATNYLFGFLATTLVDLDHLLDYFLYKGFGFSLDEFVSGRYFHVNRMIIVIFHSWELVIFLLLCFLLKKDRTRYSWVLFAALGTGVHIFLDALWYGFDPSSYLLMKRIAGRFSIELFL